MRTDLPIPIRDHSPQRAASGWWITRPDIKAVLAAAIGPGVAARVGSPQQVIARGAVSDLMVTSGSRKAAAVPGGTAGRPGGTGGTGR